MALFSWAQMTPGDEILTDFQRGFCVDKLRQLDLATLHRAIPWGNFTVLQIFTESEANEEHSTTLPPDLLRQVVRAIGLLKPPYEEFWAEFLA